MKRAGLWVLLIAGGIFSVELALTVLRSRSVEAFIRVEDGRAVAQAVQTATSAPSGAEQTGAAAAPEAGRPIALALSPEGSVLVDLIWTYRIGPRFPVTTLRAEAQDAAGQVVAAQTHTMQCGGSSLDCSGALTLILRYGVMPEGGQPAPWPPGAYTIHVTRADAGFKPSDVLVRELVVAPAN